MSQAYQVYLDTSDTLCVSDVSETLDTSDTPDTPDTPETSETSVTPYVSVRHLRQNVLPWICMSYWGKHARGLSGIEVSGNAQQMKKRSFGNLKQIASGNWQQIWKRCRFRQQLRKLWQQIPYRNTSICAHNFAHRRFGITIRYKMTLSSNFFPLIGW